MNFDSTNPFNLHGPEFLVFYVSTALAVNILIRLWIGLKENGGDLAETRQQFENAKLTDPYEIAYLRGGSNEALRIASVALIDRGLLTVDASNDYRLKTRDNRCVELANKPIERWLLLECLLPRKVTDLFSRPGLISACKQYQHKLEHLELIPNAHQMARRRSITLIGTLALVGLALAKIVIALSRGRHNIIFLVILCAVATYFALKARERRRTGKGDRFLDDLKSLFSGLKVRAKFMQNGGVTNELALLTATFGLSAASPENFPFIRKIYKKSSSAKSSNNCGTGCGSGYFYSSCGGGGCGGGGCGGGAGCGGCGG